MHKYIQHTTLIFMSYVALHVNKHECISNYERLFSTVNGGTRAVEVDFWATRDNLQWTFIVFLRAELFYYVFLLLLRLVLRVIGVKHSFSAGLIIGGRSTKERLAGEKERIAAMNIIVCTPGRLLQVWMIHFLYLSRYLAYVCIRKAPTHLPGSPLNSRFEG